MPPPGQSQRSASKFIVFEHLEKMNTQSVRQSLSEKEMAWLENLQPIAPNNFVAVPGPVVPALISISETIIAQYFAFIHGADYIISLTSTGSAWSTNLANGVANQIVSPGTFSAADVTVWQESYVLFQDPTAGYCAWDGSIFVKAGGVSPVITITNPGTGYTTPPGVLITGGSGSGATAVATIGTPAVNSVNMISGGSQYGPAPAVVFAGGGGTGAAAIANIDPRGLTSITVTNQGEYFGFSPPTGVSFSGGGGSGASATLHLDVNFRGNFVVASISISSPGSNYSSPPAITVLGTGAFGNNATATCTVGNGAVLSITLTNGGSGYTSPPTISFSGGGSGSGAAAFASIGGTSITSITLTNPGAGYLASDVLTVAIGGGGGSGGTASAHVWPFVFKGRSIAVFGGRVWLSNVGAGIQYSGTQGFDDFNAANAAGSFNIEDTDLTHIIPVLRNYNNYLFIMGDQSVKQIGNISVSGSTTLFTVVTLSSDQGTIYPRSCGSYNRVFMFVNSNGVYAVLGASVQKISDDLDGIFKLIDFSQQPQAALIDINGIHHIAFLVRYKDPLSSTRSIMLCFNGKKWFVVSQGNSLVSIVNTSAAATGLTSTYGSSGTDITKLVGDATKPVAFKIQTALTHHGNAVQRKKILSGGVAATLASGPGSLSVSYDTENGSVTKVYTIASGFTLPSGASGVEGSGRYLGITVTGTLAGFTFTNAAVEYQETALWT
jgi:hypothetical protein